MLAFAVLRAVELLYFIFVLHRSEIPSIILHGAYYDLLFISQYGTITFLLFLGFSFLSKRFARYFLIFINVILLLLASSLLLFYIKSGILLDNSVFLYSIQEIRHIIASSDSNSFVSVLLFLMVIGVYLLTLKLVKIRSAIVSILLILGMIAGLNKAGDKPKAVDFNQLENYYTSCSKCGFFTEHLIEYLSEENSPADYRDIKQMSKKYQLYHPYNSYVNSFYPFLCKDDKPDVLGEFFKLNENPPNFVFIIVEGFSGAFTGKEATLASFTPFIDSLAAKSLYWSNFLSTSEKTFGVLPSILGSLPYGRTGFQLMADSMPEHYSLISTLNNNDYYTSFMYGGWPGFTNYNTFLKAQQIDFMSDCFSDKGMTPDDDLANWGVSDSMLFAKSLAQIDTIKDSRRMDIYLTLSTHDPFRYENPEHYHHEFYRKLNEMNLSEEEHQLIESKHNVIASFIYLDRRLKNLFERYQEIDGYENTIFVLTGDHDAGYYAESPLDHYYTKLMIYSPMLKKARHFKSLGFHGNITPSLMALLRNNFKLELPKLVHWDKHVLDTAREFRNLNSFALMANNRRVNQYIDGEYFLDGRQLYALYDNMRVSPINDAAMATRMRDKLEAYQMVSLYACANNKLLFDIGSEAAVSTRMLVNKTISNNDLPSFWNRRITWDTLRYQDSVHIIPGHIIYPIHLCRYPLNEFYSKLKVDMSFDIRTYSNKTKPGSLYLAYSILDNERKRHYFRNMNFLINEHFEWEHHNVSRIIRTDEVKLQPARNIQVSIVNESGADFQLDNFELSIKGVR